MPDIRTGVIITATSRGFEAEVKRARRAQDELNKEFREGRREADGLNRVADRLSDEIRALTRIMGANSLATERLAQSHARAARASRSGASAARQYNREARQTERANRGLAGSFGALHRRVFGYIGLYAALSATSRIVRGATNAADAYTELNNRLKLVTDSEGELRASRAELLEISQDTRTALGLNANLYSRLSLAAQRFGRDEEEVLRVTELLNKQVLIGGNNAAEAGAGLTQFAQGLASGRLQGDELRSVLENLQGVSEGLIVGFARLREQGRIDFDVTRANIRELAAEGVLSADLLLDAVLASAEDTERKFADVATTVSGGLTQVSNATLTVIGRFDEAFRISERLAGSLTGLAERIQGIRAPVPDLTPAFIQAEIERLVAEQAAIAGQVRPSGHAGRGFDRRLERDLLERTRRITQLVAFGTEEGARGQLAVYDREIAAAEAELEALSGHRARNAETALARLRASREEAAALVQAYEALDRAVADDPAPADPSEEDIAAQYAERIAAEEAFGRTITQSRYDTAVALFAIETENFSLLGDAEREALEQRVESNARADKQIAENAREARNAELQEIFAHHRARLAELQGFEDEAAAIRGRAADAELAEEFRYNRRSGRLAQQGVEARRQLEAGNARAVAQITLGSAQEQLAALGRYNKRAFRLSQAAGIAKAIIDTQQGIAAALALGPPLSFVFAGLQAVQGAAAVATIRAQRPPQAFRRGGIIEDAAFFSARGVPHGVAGEAGPEAILPLGRGPSGELGVKSSGARSVVLHFSPRIEVSLEGAGADPDAIRRAGRDAAGHIKETVRGTLIDELRPGGILNSLAVA